MNVATAPASSLAASAIDALDVERLRGEDEGAARYRRDDRDLVAVGERSVASDVLAVDRVEQPAGLVAEAEPSPHVGDPLDVVELEASLSGALAQACEESDGHAHVLDHA